jgi:hypothetical protein
MKSTSACDLMVVEGTEFYCPLGDSSSSILVPYDVTERVVGDDGDRVLLEVMS